MAGDETNQQETPLSPDPLMLMRSLIPLLAVVVLLPLHPADLVGQAEPLRRDSRLASTSLRADLATLRRVYTELHPGLHRYLTPAEVGAEFDATDRYFASDRSVGDAFLALTRLTAAIRCGHSYPNFFNQSKAVASALFEGQDKLPFEFRWIGRRMIVTADHAPDADLPRGTEVLAVNGVPVGQILDSLMPLARADGGNDAKRVAYLEVRGRERYHAFDILYPLVFPVSAPRFVLSVRMPGNASAREVPVAALTASARRSQGEGATDPSPDAPLWRYAESDGVGVVTMPTWALFNSKWDAAQWMDSILGSATARAVPDLVIDLRGNEGGVDAGNPLLARLIDAPLRLPVYARHVRYRSVPEDLNKILDTWDASFRDWGAAAAGPMESGFYRLTKWDDAADGSGVIMPSSTRYRGRVWVLVDAANSSATFQFALAVKQSGVATLVGQPTGGNRRGINGGAFFFVRLPGTGIEVDLPLVAGFPTTEEPDAGVVPDILVVPSAADIANGVDAEMRAVRQAIAARQR